MDKVQSSTPCTIAIESQDVPS